MFGIKGGPCKVGRSIDPAQRAKSIRYAYWSHPPGLDVAACSLLFTLRLRDVAAADAMERRVHDLLDGVRIVQPLKPHLRFRKEWFRASLGKVKRAIRTAAAAQASPPET